MLENGAPTRGAHRPDISMITVCYGLHQVICEARSQGFCEAGISQILALISDRFCVEKSYRGE